MPLTNKDKNLLDQMGVHIPDDYVYSVRENFVKVTIEQLLLVASFHPENYHSKQIRASHAHTGKSEEVFVTAPMLEAMKTDGRTYIHVWLDHAKREVVHETRLIEYLSPPENGTTPSPEILNPNHE